MKTTDGKDIRIHFAELTHDEPAKLGKAQYRGGGKWELEICDMDRSFSRAVGYELYDTDWRMGYSTYRKTVGSGVFTGIEMTMTADGAIYNLRMPIPERLWDEIAAQAEKDGDPRLKGEILLRLTEEYGADALYAAAHEQNGQNEKNKEKR